MNNKRDCSTSNLLVISHIRVVIRDNFFISIGNKNYTLNVNSSKFGQFSIHLSVFNFQNCVRDLFLACARAPSDWLWIDFIFNFAHQNTNEMMKVQFFKKKWLIDFRQVINNIGWIPIFKWILCLSSITPCVSKLKEF